MHKDGVAFGDAIQGLGADRGVPRRDRQGEVAPAHLGNGDPELGVLVTRRHRSCHGLVRSILENHITGVQTPYSRILDIQGVGYGVAKKGKAIALKVGFSNEIVLDVPEGLTVDLPSATRVVVTGCDQQLVGLFAAKVRSVRPPEPYNGKGIKYEDERIQRKAGKSFASAGAGG